MQSVESDPDFVEYKGRYKRKMSAPTAARHRTNDGIEWVSDCSIQRFKLLFYLINYFFINMINLITF